MFIYKFAIVASLIALISGASDKEYQDAFIDYMKTYEKAYTTDEFQYRYQTFKVNYDFVDSWDSNAQGFEVGLNEFADLSNDEFKSIYNGLNVDASDRARMAVEEVAPLPGIPTSINWADKGAVTGIKNQGQCGSCWSFSTTGNLEGCIEITTGHLQGLSEQDLIDCSTSEGNMGCDGGLMDDAFEYVIKNGGIDTEASYPYTATGPNQCKYSASNSGGSITGYQNVPSKSESALTNDIATVGPISVAIDAGLPSFQFYKSGVYYAPSCSSTQLDHGVLAVGYGVTSGSVPDYYIVKNSWGTGWGNQGYIWMARNKDNNCGIATMASYSTGCTYA